MLALGLGVIWAVVAEWCSSVARQARSRRAVYDELIYLGDGSPAIKTHGGGVEEGEIYRTIEGESIPNDSAVLGDYRYPSPMTGRRTPKRGPTLTPWSRRILGMNDERRPPNYWYLVHDDKPRGSGYFVGYHSKTKLCVGYLGRSGYRRDAPPPEDRLPINGWRMNSNYGPTHMSMWRESAREPRYSNMPSFHIVSGDELVRVDVRARTLSAKPWSEQIISLAVGAPAPPSLSGAELEQLPRDRFAAALLMRLPDRVLATPYVPVQGPSHRTFDFEFSLADESRTYLLPEALRDVDFELLEFTDDRILVVTQSPLRAGAYPVHLRWISPTGEVLRHERLSLRTAPAFINVRKHWWALALHLPEPIVVGFVATAELPVSLMSSDPDQDYLSALARSLRRTWPALLTTALVSAVGAWCCVRRQRRYGAPWTWVWATFVFLGGIPGLLAYLLHRSWPALLPCGACGATAPRDRPACAHCGAEFPPPRPSGSEIFA
jgi:hypothetical protein